MNRKKRNHYGLMVLGLYSFIAPSVQAQISLGEFISIDTHLYYFFAKPSWLLILRDLESGQVLPYVYDFYQTNNHWVALSYGHLYQVTASTVTFGPYAKVHNFCGIEKTVLSHVSLTISITGALTPDRNSSQCYITYLKDYPLTLAISE